MINSSKTEWMALAKLDKQFAGNLAALNTRDPELAAQLASLRPSAEYFICPGDEKVQLSRRAAAGGELEVLSNPLTPAGAREYTTKIFPEANYVLPLMIAGLDQGWLWDAIYKLKSVFPQAPGLRLPLYLLSGDLERLWVVLHYQNWVQLLGDPRVQLLAGRDAIAQLQTRLEKNPRLCNPKMAITVEQDIWPAGENLDALTARANHAAAERLVSLHRQIAVWEKPNLPRGPLRILGITSRFTTFLQHSMRDWLGALEKMGHQTRLVIEQADHELLPTLVYGQECQAFSPHLILIIDHCRGEMPGLPRNTPCVMWIQDRLPHIYRPDAGAMQAAGDYVIGYGRQECTQRHGYPGSRFMPAMVGVNAERFVSRPLTSAEQAEYGCDVSFVSHASMPARQIIEEECLKNSTPQARTALDAIYQRLSHIYDGGGSVTEPADLQSIIEVALAEQCLRADIGPLMDLVSQRVNNALLRHQTIRWVAQSGADLRLYGRGWEKHPEFSRYARGVADNQSQLGLIYQASRINLQVTPFGAAHQRLFEGLAAGGFFLLRGVTGDAVDLVRAQLWAWCLRSKVTNPTEMAARGRNDRAFLEMASQLANLARIDPLADPQWFYSGLEEAALGGFARSASTLWPEYGQVVFWNQEQLTQKLKHYLGCPAQRDSLAASMRQAVLKWHTYEAISARMLSFIAADQAGARTPVVAVAA